MGETSSKEENRDELNSAYDLIRGFFASVVDVHERAMLVRNLELLHDTAWRWLETAAPGAERTATSQTSTTLSSGSVSGVDDLTE